MGITEELRWTAAKLMNVGKFAVDSALNESLRAGGTQVYAIVKGKLKGETPSNLANNYRKRSFVLVEEMQAKLEKMQEDVTDTEHQCTISTHITDEHEQLKEFSDEPLQSLIPEVTGRKKIFIRSRL